MNIVKNKFDRISFNLSNIIRVASRHQNIKMTPAKSVIKFQKRP